MVCLVGTRLEQREGYLLKENIKGRNYLIWWVGGGEGLDQNICFWCDMKPSKIILHIHIG